MTCGIYYNGVWHPSKEIIAHVIPYIREGVNTAPKMADRLFGANAYTGQSLERDRQVIAFRKALKKLESEGKIRRAGTVGGRHHPTTIWEAVE